MKIRWPAAQNADLGPSTGVDCHAPRLFRSFDAAGPVRSGIASTLALLERLSRGRVLGRSHPPLPPACRRVLTRDEKSAGRAFFWFLDWQFTGSNDELTDPARYQYREAFVLVEAVFEGQPVNYCPFIFVDNDSAIARGWAQGYPKKLGSIFQTRTFSAPSAAAAPLAKGSRFGASVAAHGERLATARVQLRRRSPIHRRYSIGRRRCIDFFRSLRRPARPSLPSMSSPCPSPTISPSWTSGRDRRSSRFPKSIGEDLHSLAPLRIGRGYRLGMAYSVTDLRILKNYAA